MASITFEGPSVTSPGERTTTKVEMSDEATLLVVEAICTSEGYAGDSPGLFVIEKAVAGWMHAAELHVTEREKKSMLESVQETLQPLKDSVVIGAE